MAIENLGRISELWANGLEGDGIALYSSYGPKIVNVLFTCTSTYLSAKKSKEHPVAFVFEEINKNFLLGAIVEYHAGKTAKDPGNWSYVWTFDKTDIPDTAQIFRLTDDEIKPFFNQYSMQKYNYTVLLEQFAQVYLFMVKMISKWLDDNASDSDIIGVEEPGVFQARAAVEDGVVVKSIEPAGEIKVLIKDDAAIEK